MGGNVAENLSNQSVPEAAARVAAVVNRLVNRIGSNAESRERLAEIEIPEELRDNLALFLRLERRVLSEYDPEIADLFDKILSAEIVVNAGNPGTRAADEAVDEQGVPTADEPTAVAFREVVELIDSLPLDKQQVIVRAFTSFFHLANLSEENYRVAQLREREAGASTDTEVDPANELTVAYHQLVNEMGVEGANELLGKLEFHPVFTAHPTEARRKAVEGKIRRISNLLEERPRLGGSDLVENERHMLQEIDALVRTSPIALKKPTPVEEADTIIDIFDNTLFDVIPVIYRRFDDWVLGDKAGTVPPLCPAFFHPGSWIGSDRDGNPNVTAKVSREVAAKYFTHMVLKLEDKCRRIGRNLTLEATYSKPSAELINLWNHQVEMMPRYTARAELISEHEPHRAVMLVMADRLNATVCRITDTMYHSADEFLEDLRVVQRSLAACGAVRAAYGPVQTIIWQVESFGFHMVEMEFRQHSVVHARALKDIHENGIHGDLQPMTREVIDTFRAIGSIQKRYGKKMAHRYIISFTKSAQHVADVFELAHLSFAHEEDVPELDVIPLFEQLEDLEGCVDVLDQMLTLPVVQKRLAQTNRRMEVMLGYSDSSKDAGPTTAMLALHSAQERIAKWAEKNDIDLVLMHGRGGAVGRGGGPANKAVLAQPKGSVNCFFKLTEQGEVIFARYGNRTLAQRHVESVAAATLLQSAPSVEKTNTETTQKFWDMAEKLNTASHERYLDLLNTEDHIQYLFGYPDGTFGPENNMTRAEVAQMFYNLLLDQDVEITKTFDDVPANAWYAKAVNTLASLDIISGVGDNKFEPERSITRAEFTAMAMKFAVGGEEGENIFSDVDENDWFYDAVVNSIQYGWIHGYGDGTFRPNNPITRAEVTAIVNNMLGRAADEDFVDEHAEELTPFSDIEKHWAYYHIVEATNDHDYTKPSSGENWTKLN